MVRRFIALLLLLPLAWMGCARAGSDEHSKSGAQQPERESRPLTEKEQIESEVREGGLRDPGGAKDVRQESEEQQKEQQDQVNEVDQQ